MCSSTSADSTSVLEAAIASLLSRSPLDVSAVQAVLRHRDRVLGDVLEGVGLCEAAVGDALVSRLLAELPGSADPSDPRWMALLEAIVPVAPWDDPSPEAGDADEVGTWCRRRVESWAEQNEAELRADQRVLVALTRAAMGRGPVLPELQSVEKRESSPVGPRAAPLDLRSTRRWPGWHAKGRPPAIERSHPHAAPAATGSHGRRTDGD